MVIASGVTTACPVKMYLRYMDLLGTYLFSYLEFVRSKNVCKLIYKNKKLSYTAARTVSFVYVKISCRGHVNIGIHSLRSGRATVAASSNVDERCLKRHGRRKSNLAKDGYIVDSIDKRLMVSKSLNL